MQTRLKFQGQLLRHFTENPWIDGGLKSGHQGSNVIGLNPSPALPRFLSEFLLVVVVPTHFVSPPMAMLFLIALSHTIVNHGTFISHDKIT